MLIQSIAELSEASDAITLRRGVAAFGKAHGFEACFFLTPVARNNRQGRILANLGFDQRWERAYRRTLYKLDPLPEIGLTYAKAFRWGLAGRMRSLEPAEQRYMNILARCGMGDGLAIPMFGCGARAGIAGFGLHPDLDSITSEQIVEIQTVTQSAYQTYCRLISSEFSPENALSGRERDVLYWLTQGKSNSAIGTILEISPATVDTYVRRVFRKLGVSDRVGAAMAAVQHGYVISGKYRQFSTPDPSD